MLIYNKDEGKIYRKITVTQNTAVDPANFAFSSFIYSFRKPSTIVDVNYKIEITDSNNSSNIDLTQYFKPNLRVTSYNVIGTVTGSGGEQIMSENELVNNDYTTEPVSSISCDIIVDLPIIIGIGFTIAVGSIMRITLNMTVFE